MQADIVGWDIGGAHLKAVAIKGDGTTLAMQIPMPLWLSLDHLDKAIATIKSAWASSASSAHAVTMTGELADLFDDRHHGVSTILQTFTHHFPGDTVHVFAGERGFVYPAAVTALLTPHIASANWLATTQLAASRWPEGLLIDIGSTTTDLMIFKDGKPWVRGLTDLDRLRHQELVYTGIVRTPLMAVTRQAPWHGEWLNLMAEHFATTADIYRLTAELPAHADQSPTADGGEKSPLSSARRLGRMLGADLDSGQTSDWLGLAHFFRQQQLDTIQQAIHRQLSRGLLDTQSCFVGAGIGRFLVQELAHRLGYPYRDFVEILPMQKPSTEFDLSDCAPAAAVACLLRTAL